MYESIQKKYNPKDDEKEELKSNIDELKKTYHENMQPHLKTIEVIKLFFFYYP